MAKYTSDPNLIRGAAVAYKDWSNVPGMYAGLDKITKAGQKMAADAIKKRNDERDKMNKIAEQALLRGGGLGKNHYDYSTGVVERFKQDYWKGATTRGPEGEKLKMGSMMNLQNHIIEVTELKDINKYHAEQLLDPEKPLTNAMSNQTYETSPDVYTSRNAILGKMMANDYTPSQNKEGQTIYTMDIDGTKHSITKDQYSDLAGLQNYKPGNALTKQIQKSKQLRNFDPWSFKTEMLKSLPDDAFGLESVIADGWNEEDIGALVKKYVTKDVVEREAFGKTFNTDGGGISDEEYNNFLDAVFNFSGPESKNNLSDVGITKKVLAEVATLYGNDLHTKHWANKNQNTGLNGNLTKYQVAKGVYLTEAQIKSNIQDILNASSGTQIPRSDGFGSLEKRGGQWYERTYKANADGEQVPSERRISVDDAITIQGYSNWYNKKDSSEKTFDWTSPYKIITNL
tara:strand:- start:2721 stop:4091 length:1371 start_codon:yes stop_codon:yes gene_type:complete